MTRQKPSMTKSSRQKAGPIPAREIDVSKAEAINALLTRPIPILPMKAGDPIRPFALGLWAEIRLLLRPEFSVSMLRRATGAYLHSKRYHLAIAQPDSVRHDIDGTPIGTVSDADRLAAQEKIQSLSMRDDPRNTISKATPPRFSANPAFEGRYVPRCPSQPE